MELSRADKIRCAIMGRLPGMGDTLPVCGGFYRGRWFTGAERLEDIYPRWFVWCCRVEASVYIAIRRLCMRGV